MWSKLLQSNLTSNRICLKLICVPGYIGTTTCNPSHILRLDRSKGQSLFILTHALFASLPDMSQGYNIMHCLRNQVDDVVTWYPSRDITRVYIFTFYLKLMHSVLHLYIFILCNFFIHMSFCGLCVNINYDRSTKLWIIRDSNSRTQNGISMSQTLICTHTFHPV